MKRTVAVIGAGISGLTVARLLRDDFDVTVFESDCRPGGLIKCRRVDGNLYHMVGGHVFNSRRADVLEYFWGIFDRETEFISATRNAAIFLGKPIGYPIENHLAELGPETVEQVVAELLELEKSPAADPTNFADFLKRRFGDTLYELYFRPYNEKIWRQDLHDVPLDWLAGKLPMPTVAEILANNINKSAESAMVHSSFYYPRNNGSQFLVDRLSSGINIRCDASIHSIRHDAAGQKWVINGNETFDCVIYAGNLKQLPGIVTGSVDLGGFDADIRGLAYHGTTTVLCEVDCNPYSWIYLPDPELKAHRIINTGNFSATNNRAGILSATIEFTDEVGKDEILDTLARAPYHPKYIDHQFTPFTYPIQKIGTRKRIDEIKSVLEPKGMYLLGRFAEWEYYNMDAAIGAAIDLAEGIRKRARG